MKYQIKEEVRGNGKSTFLPMFTDDDMDQSYSIEMDGTNYDTYDEALDVINNYKESLLHYQIVETKIHTIE
jgi:hypothetical protein